MNKIVKPKVAQALIGTSRKPAKDAPPSEWPWFVWPEDCNSMEAMMADALIGPFPDKAAAEKAAKEIWWEIAE